MNEVAEIPGSRQRSTSGRLVGAVASALIVGAATLATAQVPEFGAGGPPASALDYGNWAYGILNAPPPGLNFLPTAETDLLARLNDARARTGLPSVAGSSDLQAVARVHAVDMIERGFFDHVNPDGRNPADRVAILDRRFIGTTGENIAEATGSITRDERALADRFHLNWMNSDGHRRNILGSDWNSVGIGVAYRNGMVAAVQVFGFERARLASAAPIQVRRGERLDLRARSADAPAQLFDLWDPARMAEAAPPRAVLGGAVGAPAGTYGLRFYFPQDNNRFQIYTGPQIIVQ